MSVRDEPMQVIVDSDSIRVVSAGETGPASLSVGDMVLGTEGQVVTVVGGAPVFADAPGTPVDANQTIVGDPTNAGKAVATQYIFAEAYGDLSPSTGDAAANVTTLNAAITAADAIGATVVVPPQSIPINAKVTIPEYVGLVGGGINVTVFLATTSSAQLEFSAPSYAKISDWTFDGNSVATVGVTASTSNGASFRNIRVTGVVGDSFHIYNVQNASFDNIETQYNTKGFYVDDGCGSCVFNALKSSGNEYYQLKIAQSGTVVSGYTEPTAITFIGFMGEWLGSPASTANAVAVVDIQGCNRATFINSNFVPCSDRTVPAVKIRVVGGASQASVHFIDSEMIGSQTNNTGIDAGGNGSLAFSGKCAIVGALVGIKLTDGMAIKSNTPAFQSTTTELSYAGSASRANLIQYEYDERQFQARATDAFVMRVQEFGESNPRWSMDSKGNMEWGGGSGGTDVRLYRAITGVLSTESGQMFRAFGGLITATKAGTPTDADTVFDTDGTMIVDTSASKLWIRISGTWKSVTLT